MASTEKTGTAKTSPQDLMRNALKEIKTLKRRLAEYDRSAHEPIAIVGMSCRYPGSSNDPQAFWQNLVDGVDCITQQENNERWNMDDLYDPDPDAPGKVYSKGLGILDQVDEFDAEFFGISPREADDIDPQHRLLLEVCHETMESAGYAPSRLNGQRVGVFMGVASGDYAHLGSILGTAEALTPWQGIGNAMSAAPCRISYLYNFKGPALALDTACSSSLTALHYACQSLRNRECDSALSGGVHLVLNPAISIVFAKARMLAPDGRCKTFDASADGYVRSEGCGVVMLKRLSDAERDGDRILALIKGSGLNQDGKSQGFTAPNESAQEDCIRAALQQAQLTPDSVSYVEAHGTGTPLGDPIELGALNTVYCAGQGRRHPLLVGSAKTNIGHSEAAAGIAGLIKLVLSLQHRTLPPHINYTNPNPYIPWNKMAIQVTDKRLDWNAFAAPDGRLRAGVSAFAFTGTNVHVILEEYEKQTVEKAEGQIWLPNLVLASAKQPQALSQWNQSLQDHLRQHPDTDLSALIATCARGRDHYKYRQAILTADPEQLQSLLASTGTASPQVLKGQKLKPSHKVAFVFSGQGSQFAGMGKSLYDSIPVFREQFDEVLEHLSPHLNLPTGVSSLAEVIWGVDPVSQDTLQQTAYTQPALFAIEYALAKTWMHWGIKPDCVSGHSVGEITAATIAGVFSLADACRLVAVRGRLMGQSPQGSMLVVFADLETVEKHLQSYPALSVCAMNGPLNTVVGGPKDDVSALQQALEQKREEQQREEQQSIQCRKLPVQHAFHTASMDGILNEFSSAIQSLTFNTPRMRILSNLNGEHLGAKMANADYWVQQIRQPVNFMACARGLVAAGMDVVVETGPGTGLVSLVQAASADSLISLASLRQREDGLTTLTRSLAQAYVAGLDPDWARVVPGSAPTLLLPTYAFQRKSYWNETLRAHLQRQALPEQAKDWLYQLRWEVTDIRSDLPVGEDDWLLLFPTYSQGDAFASNLPNSRVTLAQFQRQGADMVLQLGQQQEQLTGEASELLKQALSMLPETQQLATQQSGPLKLVLSVAGLVDDAPLAEPDVMVQTCEAMTRLMLSVAKSLQQCSNVECWLITESATNVNGQTQPVLPEQAMMSGFGKNLALELADKFRSALDVDEWNEDSRHHCLQVMASNGEQPPSAMMALRNGQWYLPSVQRLASETLPGKTQELDSKGYYVVAGGTGSLGLALAEWLVKNGVRHLALLSRKGLPEVAVQRVENMRRQGAEITLPKVDLGNRDELDSVLSSLRSEQPLVGVFHCAGAFELAPLQDLDLVRCQRVMDNKVLGIQWLDQLTRDDPLQYFVAYSSIASIWGSAGNFHYCAANQVVDAVLQARTQQGKPALLLNWGPWANSGMVTDESEAQASRRGLMTMEQGIGTQMGGHLMVAGSSQVIVANVIWQRFRPVMEMTGMGRLFSQVEDVSAAMAGPSGAGQLTTAVELNEDDLRFKQELATCDVEERAPRLLTYLKQQLGKALQMNPDDIDERQPLIDMGIDSLLAVEFKNRVTQVTDVELPVVRMLGGASLRDVSQWMADGYGVDAGAGASGVVEENHSEEDDVVEGVL